MTREPLLTSSSLNLVELSTLVASLAFAVVCPCPLNLSCFLMCDLCIAMAGMSVFVQPTWSHNILIM